MDSESTLPLLHRSRLGDVVAREALYSRLYGALREVAAAHLRRQEEQASLAPTELVHELFLRLDFADLPLVNDRRHLMAIASNVMRRVLIDQARARRATKRRARLTVTLDETVADALADAHASAVTLDAMALADALERLAAAEPRVALVFERRAFGGLALEEIATDVGVSLATVKRDWQFARAFLANLLAGPERVPPLRGRSAP